MSASWNSVMMLCRERGNRDGWDVHWNALWITDFNVAALEA